MVPVYLGLSPSSPTRRELVSLSQFSFVLLMQARKKLCQLKDTARFQSLTQDHTYMKQASTALSYTHSWCRIQDQIRTRRLRMVQEGRIRQKNSENQLKLEAKLHELEVLWVWPSLPVMVTLRLLPICWVLCCQDLSSAFDRLGNLLTFLHCASYVIFLAEMVLLRISACSPKNQKVHSSIQCLEA